MPENMDNCCNSRVATCSKENPLMLKITTMHNNVPDDASTKVIKPCSVILQDCWKVPSLQKYLKPKPRITCKIKITARRNMNVKKTLENSRKKILKVSFKKKCGNSGKKITSIMAKSMKMAKRQSSKVNPWWCKKQSKESSIEESRSSTELKTQQEDDQGRDKWLEALNIVPGTISAVPEKFVDFENMPRGFAVSTPATDSEKSTPSPVQSKEKDKSISAHVKAKLAAKILTPPVTIMDMEKHISSPVNIIDTERLISSPDKRVEAGKNFSSLQTANPMVTQLLLSNQPKAEEHANAGNMVNPRVAIYRCINCTFFTSTIENTEIENHMISKHHGAYCFCPICYVKLASRQNFVQHLESCHADDFQTGRMRPVNADFMLVDFSDIVTRDSMTDCEDNELLCCQNCARDFEHFHVLHQHLFTHKELKQLYCHKCKVVIASDLVDHVNRAKCTAIFQPFTFISQQLKESLTSLFFRVTRNDAEDEETRNKDTCVSVGKTLSKETIEAFRCLKCKHTDLNKEDMILHCLSHVHEDMPISCIYCGLYEGNLNTLNSHVHKEHKKVLDVAEVVKYFYKTFYVNDVADVISDQNPGFVSSIAATVSGVTLYGSQTITSPSVTSTTAHNAIDALSTFANTFTQSNITTSVASPNANSGLENKEQKVIYSFNNKNCHVCSKHLTTETRKSSTEELVLADKYCVIKESSGKYYKCRICGFRTEHFVAIEKHVTYHKTNLVDNKEAGQVFRCTQSQCQFNTSFKRLLDMHAWTDHGIKQGWLSSVVS